ncbi:MAG: hypothetical protein JW945_03435 [Methanomicrobia archaeon]|nr:hypothetical protein [Methanomicrobia archaeon]
MELEFEDEKRIRFAREFSELDRFVFEFVRVLNNQGIRYVVVSGYITILFGRTRTTEDIDLLSEKISFDEFNKLWLMLSENYECLNTTDVTDAYSHYLLNATAVRFAKKEQFIPNIEFKFIKDEVDYYSLTEAIEVRVGDNTLNISPLELQIAYKMFLGSEKDLEDAMFLFALFTEYLDLQTLMTFLTKFGVEDATVKQYLKGLL